MKPYLIFRLGNKLYKQHTFWLYLPFYRLYKAVHERSERRLIKQVIEPGQCVIDIGANVGVYTCIFSKLVGPTGEVHAFEPDPKNFSLLRRVMKDTANSTINQMAISRQTGPITLYRSDDLNVDHRTYPTGETRTAQTVDGITLDDYLQGKPVHFIKMDIQGYEYSALQGMQETLNRNENLNLLMELWPYGLKCSGDPPEKLMRLLQQHAFKTYLFDHSRLVPVSEPKFNCDETTYYDLFVTRQPFQIP